MVARTLLNLAADPVDVRLVNQQGKVINGQDVLNLENVKGDLVHLEVKGVRLIELEEWSIMIQNHLIECKESLIWRDVPITKRDLRDFNCLTGVRYDRK